MRIRIVVIIYFKIPSVDRISLDNSDLSLPIANAIAIDQDHINKLSFYWPAQVSTSMRPQTTWLQLQAQVVERARTMALSTRHWPSSSP